MMIFRLLLILLLIPSLSWGATYYVDCAASAGGDGSLATPWDAIADVNGAAFSAGDNILLKSGCTFREQLTVPSSGSAGLPITIGSYGTGAKPVISGADTVTTEWTETVTQYVYRTALGSITSPTQLYCDDTYYSVAHDPNSMALLTPSATSANAITLTDAESTYTEEQVVGATMQSKVYNWDISSSVIASYNTGTHVYTMNAGDYLYKDCSTGSACYINTTGGYWLENMLWMVDQAGEWYYDGSNYLYFWSPDSATPSTHTVEIPKRTYGIYINDKDYITIQDLDIRKAEQFDIYTLLSSNIHITGCDISGGKVGIGFRTTSYIWIDGNNIHDIVNDGILTANADVFSKAGWSTTDSQCGYTDFHITNNTISNIATIGQVRNDSEAAIGGCGQNWDISGNTISNTAYIGILMQGSGVADRNTLTNVVMQMSDGGALYTHNQSGIAVGTKVFSNNVVNTVPGMMIDGTTPIVGVQAECIYLDGNASTTTVNNNVCISCNEGLFNNGGSNNSWLNNTVYGGLRYYLYVAELYPTDLTGLTVKNNLFYQTKSSLSFASPIKISSTKDSYTYDFGEIDYNLYYHNNYYYTAWDVGLDVINLDVAPATDWVYGNKITGQTSGAYAYVMNKLTDLTYEIYSKSGTFTLGEVVGVTGTPEKLADQGAGYPTITVNSGTASHIFTSLAGWQAYTSESLGNNWDAHSKEINPLFTSPTNFHLLPGSPAINAGTDVSLTSDIEGRAIPLWGLPDIGAYEYAPGQHLMQPNGRQILQ